MATKRRTTAKRKPAAKRAGAKRATGRAKKPSRKAMNDVLVVQSKFKDALKAHGVNVSADAAAGANQILHWYCEQAVKRAQANGRKTVRAHDFISM